MSVIKEKVCRACLIVSTVNFPIVNDKIRNYFTEISGLTMSKESDLPCSLCYNCLRLLKQSVKFKNACINADKLLIKTLESTESKKGQFNIEDLHEERRKQFNESYLLTFTQIVTVDCIDKNQQKNASVTREINEKSSEKPLTEQIFNNDQLYTEEFYITGHTSSRLKNIPDKLCSIDENSMENNSLMYFASNKEENIIKQEFDDTLSTCLNNIKEYEGLCESELPVIKNEFNIDNGISTDDLFRDTEATDYDFSKKYCKFGSKLKSKKRVSNVALKKPKVEAKTKKKQNVDKIEDIDAQNEKKSRVIYFHFDETAVIIDKLSIGEQLSALEAARGKTQYIEAPFKCEPCAKYFLHELSLQGHMKRHEEAAGEYICMICTQRYSTPRNLRNHNTVHEERLQCKQCSQVVCGRASMAKHIAGHNGLCPKFECEVCGKITASKRNHKRHMLVHTCPSIAKKYKCPYCPRTFSLTSSRNDHATRAHTTGDRYFPCDICDRTFLNKTCLRIHAVTHSEKKEFYCVECDKSFKRQSTLDNHLKVSIRHGNYAFLKHKCDQCDKRYDTALKLKAHVDCTHLQLLNWACDKCPSKFLSRSGLSLHRRKIHEGKVKPKNHICSMCGKAFTCKFMLDKHVRIHTGELPFSCEICERPFCQKSTLETHVKLVHLKLKRPFGKSKPGNVKNIEDSLTNVNLPMIKNPKLDN